MTGEPPFEPTPMLYGVPITPQEFRQAIEETRESITTLRDPSQIFEACVTIANAFEILPQIEPVAEDDETALLEQEDYMSKVAHATLTSVRNQLPSEAIKESENQNPLANFKATPLKDRLAAERRARENQQLEDQIESKKQQAEDIRRQIEEKEANHAVTGTFLRNSAYDVNGESKNGIWLKRSMDPHG